MVVSAPQEAVKPTLHEIANAAGFGSGAMLARAHYDPKFGIGAEPSDGPERLYRVEIEWSVSTSGSDTVEVWATNEEEAEEKAEAEWDPEHEDAEIDSVSAELKP